MLCRPKGATDGKRRRVAVPQGPRPEEGDDDQDAEDELFNDPFSALVKNCNVLHIVGPACIFLKQGFSQTVVRSRTAGSVTPRHHIVSPSTCVDPFPLVPFHHTSDIHPSIHLSEQVRQLNVPAAHIKSGRTVCSMETIETID